MEEPERGHAGRDARWSPCANALAAVRSTAACRTFPTPSASNISTQCSLWRVPRTPTGRGKRLTFHPARVYGRRDWRRTWYFSVLVVAASQRA
eukprot:1599675-Rhodomonas_salina.1